MNSQTTAQLTKLVGVLREELAARNRDLEIEAALEKVRAKTASMQRSEELVALTTTLSKELKRLSGDIYSCGIALCSHDSPLQDFSLYNGEGLLLNYSMPFSANATHARMYESWKSGAESFAELLEGEGLRAHQADMLALASYRKLTDQLAAAGSALPVSFQAFYTANFNHGYLLLITTKPFREIPMLKRFAKVFDQGYTRFLDLKKAEAQAREAQIEAALERVRSRSMSMQHSHELSEVVEKVFKEDQQLGFEALAVDLMVFTEDNSGYDIWISTPRGTEGPFRTPEKLASNVHHQGTVKAWQNRDSVRVTELTGDLFDSYFSIAMDENAWKKGQSDLFTSNPKTINDETFLNMLSKEDKDAIKSLGRIVHTEVFTRHACIRVASLEKRSEAQIDIQKRFTRVFDQSYTRFLDLQRAEAQAREARIEAALEKVRGRAMAMNSSSDLSTTSSMVFSELRKLDINPIRTGVDLLSTNSRRGLLYVAASASDNHTLALTGSIDMGAHPILAAQYESWLKRENYFPVLSPDELKSYYKEMANQLSLPALPYEQFQHREYGYYLPFSEGLLFAWSENPYSENEFAILNRFKTIIDLTFKRYLDLQKAENQARESRIEASLERVRSRTLAMFRSDELAETAAVLFKQLIDLGIAPNRLYIGIIKDESGDIELWATDEDGSKVNTSFTGNKFRNSSIKKMYDGWKQRAQTITIDMRGEELTSYFEYLKGELQVPFQLGLSQKRRVQSLAYFSKGFIGMASPEPQSDESLHLLERFAGVFNLTYIRFADLQHAEAQAREAKIEVALERVRARALAMQHSDELFEVANTLRTQMGLLGQPELETSAVHLYQEDREDFDSWYAWRPSKSTDEPVSGGATIFPINACDLTREMIALYKSAETTYTIKLETGSKKWQDWSAVLAKAAPEIFENLQALDPYPYTAYFHFSDFIGGSLLMVSYQEPGEEARNLQRRAASVFSLAYQRFLDLQKKEEQALSLLKEKQRLEQTLSELRATQAQLIQSEKMASLGELTAGIAHEIQNPLNFVNNFSEVNTELIDEAQSAFESGDAAEALGLLQNLRENQVKINQHGKRADSIVKGMLQHSRAAAGQKEITDINQLADEYLRLSYQGLRARDKGFNAILETSFDPATGNASIIAQDIGRVLLNLYNNAFYAVTEKKKKAPAGYVPTVSVYTRQVAGKIHVTIKDNGDGIPIQLLEKVFQPFFTTKPSGQGTGLGLSLSYDIVKAHSGEIKVETSAGLSTSFTVILPV